MATVAVDSCERIIEDAMTELVIEFPIYAQLIARIGIKIVNLRHEHHIAWTDGKAIYVNKYYVERNNRYPIRENRQTGETIDCTVGYKQMVFILAHELSHLLLETYNRASTVGVEYDSFERGAKKKRKLWNNATDYEINSNLHNNEEFNTQDNRYEHKEVGRMPEFVLYDSKYRNKIAEEIFKELVQESQNNNNQQQQPNSNGNGGGGNGSGQNQNQDDDFDNQDDDEDPPYSDEDDDEVPKYVDFDMDKHEPITDEDTRNEVLAKIADVLGNRTQGVGSSALDRIIKKVFQKEPFNWRKALAKYIRGWMKDNYTWNKPSRAGIANNIILPSQGQTPKMHVAVAIDTSGSVGSNELATLLNHLFTILQVYKDFQVDVWCVSTQVHEDTFKTFTAQNKKELAQYQTKSDGGTCLKTCFDFIDKKYKVKKPDVFILMSDFYDSLDGDTTTKVNYPCIWFVIDHEGFRQPTQIKGVTYPITIRDGKM